MSFQILTTLVLPILVIVIMYGLGLTLSLSDFRRVAASPKPVLIGLIFQVIVMPAVAFGLCYLFQLPEPFAIGLVLLAASPGGPSSNLYSKLTHGDVALNLTLTAVNSLLSPFTLPLLTGIAIQLFSTESQTIGLQFTKVIEVFFLVTVPVGAGMITKAKKSHVAAALDRPVRIFSVIALASIVIATGFKEWRNLIEHFVQVGVPVLLFNVLSLTFGYWAPRLCKLPREQAIAIAFEIGVHSAGLALYVAINVLNSTAIATPAAIYGVLMYITAAVLAKILR